MKGKRAPFLILAGLVIAVQLTTTLTETEFYLTQLIMAALYSLVVTGLCLLMGYAGQISLGHAGFFAIGGYTAATLTTLNLLPYRTTFIVRLLEKSGLTLSAALLISGTVAFLIGIPVLRLKGHYLAMATLGFGTIVYRIAIGSTIFGEADGISDVPGFPLLGGLVVDGSRSQRVFCYYFVWILVLALLALVSNLVDSRSGRALRAIHGNEEAAQAMGVDTSRLKLYLFVLSALFATVAGVFLTHYNGGIGPSESGVMKSVRYVAIVAVGGMASLWGTLSVGILLNFLSLRGYFGSLDDAVFGGVLIAVMLFAPQGILHRFRANRSAEEKTPKKDSDRSQPQTEKEEAHGTP